MGTTSEFECGNLKNTIPRLIEGREFRLVFNILHITVCKRIG